MSRAEAGGDARPLLLPSSAYSSSASVERSLRPPARNPRRAAAAAPPEVAHDAPAPDVAPASASRIDHVMIGFFRKRDSNRGGLSAWLRWANSLLGGEINHVELIFRLDGARSLACSVLVEDGVRFKERTVENRYVQPYWDLRSLALSDAQKMRLYEFCAAQNGKRFNRRAVAWNFLPCCFPACCGRGDAAEPLENEEWFCSQLILAALQYVDDKELYACESPAHTHPQALFDLLDASGAFANVVAYRGDPSALRIEI